MVPDDEDQYAADEVAEEAELATEGEVDADTMDEDVEMGGAELDEAVGKDDDEISSDGSEDLEADSEGSDEEDDDEEDEAMDVSAEDQLHGESAMVGAASRDALAK